MVKIGVHHTKGSFSEDWLEYFIKKGISYKLVNCYESNIIEQLNDCDGLMWHFQHDNYKDELFAKQLLLSVELSGKKVFPNFKTAWHFDDKIGQKYLLESIKAPLVPTYVFFEKKTTLEWINETSFPKVFKLRGGAGSSNVRLIRSKAEARNIVQIAFDKGFKQFDGKEYFLDSIRKFKTGTANIESIIKAFGRMLISTAYSKIKGREKGYVYFQDFVPNNDSDTRIIVIGDKAFGIKRGIRKNDFRASGSGHIIYDKNLIDPRAVKVAFETAKKIDVQCCAFDFVFTEDGSPLIVEVSYGYSKSGYIKCEGYWDETLNFNHERIRPQDWMVDLIHDEIEVAKLKK